MYLYGIGIGCSYGCLTSHLIRGKRYTDTNSLHITPSRLQGEGTNYLKTMGFKGGL
jgi:hypothetical protein